MVAVRSMFDEGILWFSRAVQGPDNKNGYNLISDVSLVIYKNVNAPVFVLFTHTDSGISASCLIFTVLGSHWNSGEISKNNGETLVQVTVTR